MWTSFLCWFLGHKFTAKKVTGETVSYTDVMDGNMVTIPLKVWEQLPFCPRCAKPNLNYDPTDPTK